MYSHQSNVDPTFAGHMNFCIPQREPGARRRVLNVRLSQLARNVEDVWHPTAMTRRVRGYEGVDRMTGLLVTFMPQLGQTRKGTVSKRVSEHGEKLALVVFEIGRCSRPIEVLYDGIVQLAGELQPARKKSSN
jgi:hypothetical protein